MSRRRDDTSSEPPPEALPLGALQAQSPISDTPPRWTDRLQAWLDADRARPRRPEMPHARPRFVPAARSWRGGGAQRAGVPAWRLREVEPPGSRGTPAPGPARSMALSARRLAPGDARTPAWLTSEPSSPDDERARARTADALAAMETRDDAAQDGDFVICEIRDAESPEPSDEHEGSVALHALLRNPRLLR